MTEETTAAELGLSVEDLKDPAKVTAAAEALEAENKAAKEAEAPTQEEKVLHDQLGRLKKAAAAKEARLNKSAEAEEPVPPTTLSELDVDNRVFVRTKNLTQKQIQVLENYRNLPTNEGKSFEEIYGSVAVQAEMKEIQAELDAEAEIDANANEDQLRATKTEIADRFAKSGEEPTTDYERQIVAERELAKVPGLRNY